jgi:dolichyl-phosphate beta-glucosyltransferase
VRPEPAGRPFLSVVVPAYNEERRLGASLERIAAWLEARAIDGEIVVVDDGSADGTARVATEQLKGRRGRVLRQPENRGKGAAVRRGALEAQGRWVLLSDADLSSPIEEYDTLAAAARERDADVAIGSRGLRESKIEVRQNLVRQSMGKTFNLAIRTMTGLPFRDTQCGFKLMDRERVRPLFEKMVVDRFAFDVELLFLCRKFGLAVVEVPVVWRNAPGSKVSIFRDPLNMLADVARVRWRFRRGLYNPEASDRRA